MISAYDSKHVAKEAFQKGAYDFIIKPSTPQVILQKIIEVLKKKGKYLSEKQYPSTKGGKMPKKIIVTVILFISFTVIFLRSSNADQYNAVNVVPQVIQGLADVVSAGKDVNPEGYTGDVDHHTVTFTRSLTSLYNGINLAEYSVSDKNFTVLKHIFSQRHNTRVLILPGPNNKAFVILKEREIENAYKLTLDVGAQKITVEQIKNRALWKAWSMPYALKFYKSYDISFHFGYESSGGAGGDRITITENMADALGTGLDSAVVLDKKLYQLGLDRPSTYELFRFFIGTTRSDASFTHEEIKVIE